MKITENETLETYKSLYESARKYGEKSINCDTIKKLWKKKDYIIVKRVNTPEKIPAVYIFIKNEHTGKSEPNKVWFTFFELEGRYGKSYVGMMNNKLFMLKSHVFDRFIERHGWAGGREECEDYFLLKMVLLYCDTDEYTREVNMAFDDGMLLGHYIDDMFIIRTYINISDMYNNQKIKTKYQQIKLKEAKLCAEYIFNPVFAAVLDKLENLKQVGEITK